MSKTKQILARVLVDTILCGEIPVKVNDVVEGDTADINALVDAGVLDKNAKAVAYAQEQNLGKKVISISSDEKADGKGAALTAAKEAVQSTEQKFNAAGNEQDRQAAQLELTNAREALQKLEAQ